MDPVKKILRGKPINRDQADYNNPEIKDEEYFELINIKHNTSGFFGGSRTETKSEKEKRIKLRGW